MKVAACRRLLSLAGSDPFLRGYMLRVSQHIARVPYVRAERAKGSTKYSVKKMIQLAQVSFLGNLKRIADFGFRLVIGSLAVMFSLFGYVTVGWIRGGTSPGWLSLAMIMLLFHSVIITLLGSILLRLRDTEQRKIVWTDWIIEERGME
jgi:dolichol-phosphate mannosyltransferase